MTTTAGSATLPTNGSLTIAAGAGAHTVVHVGATRFAEVFPVARVILVSLDGGGGTLTVSNAPSEVGEKFEAISRTVVDISISRNTITVGWIEGDPSGTHGESVTLIADLTTGTVKTLTSATLTKER